METTDKIYPEGKIITIPFEDPAFRTFGGEEFDFNWRLRQHNILAESVTTNKIADGAITEDKIATGVRITITDLDDLDDGSTYSRVLTTDITAGHVLLSSVTGDLDDIANGTSYGKVAVTSIAAGKIIVAGLDSGVTTRMFTDSATQTNIEAWKHASDVTLIDGGDIYANTVTVAKINSDATTRMFTDSTTKTNIEGWKHGSDVTKIDGGDIYTNTITATQIAANTITATQIAANTITTNQLKISKSDNTTERFLMVQGSAIVEIVDYKGQNVDHQITSWPLWSIETDTFFTTRISDPDHGGLFICALADGECWAAYAVYAIMNANANTSKDGTASAVIVEEPLKGNPATHTYTSWNANANIWGIRTVPDGSGERMVFFVDEDGDYFHDGGGTGYQNEDDIQMVKDLENILTGKISKSAMKEKDVYKKHKVVNVSEVYDKRFKKKRLDRYISGKKKDLLLMGAIRQLNEKIKILETKIGG